MSEMKLVSLVEGLRDRMSDTAREAFITGSVHDPLDDMVVFGRRYQAELTLDEYFELGMTLSKLTETLDCKLLGEFPDLPRGADGRYRAVAGPVAIPMLVPVVREVTSPADASLTGIDYLMSRRTEPAGFAAMMHVRVMGSERADVRARVRVLALDHGLHALDPGHLPPSRT